MIQLPNLDDQIFDDIAETARRRVMQYCPQWTNFNPSDPGLTILELFAWLKEMQQYRLNRITRPGILSCLHLLGMSPYDAAPAQTTVVFDTDKPFVIPKGHPFTTVDGTVFETIAPVSPGNGGVFAVWIDNGHGPVNAAIDGGDTGIAIQPFGENETIDACLYIGFFGIKDTRLRLYFEIEDDYPVKRTPFGDDSEPPREVVWEYGPQFTRTYNVEDMTRGFSVSGEVVIDLTEDDPFDGWWQTSKPDPSMPKCYWLRARLAAKGAEESPRIKKLYKDFAALCQHETLCRAVDAEAADKTITLTDYQGINGELIIFAASDSGNDSARKQIKLPHSRITRTELETRIKTNGNGQFRIVSVKPGFVAIYSTLTNLPGVKIDILTAYGYITEIALMIEDGGLWYDWQYTKDLHTAGPYDRVFTVEDETIIFGDNEHGACPPAGTDNVLISHCVVTLGKDGNILPETLNDEALSATNITFGESGRNPESIEQALTRVVRHLSATDRCVTREDFEQIASATPGTRIIKTHAVEGFDPKTGLAGIPALVTVIVQPYGTSELPLPDKRLLERVEKHLEKSRLLTTRVQVAAPEYVPVSVSVSVIAQNSETARTSIRERLAEFLSPTQGRLGIGAAVLVADVTAAISSCAGVSRVLSLTLGAPENMAPIDRSGNVLLPPHRIAYAGEIEISVV